MLSNLEIKQLAAYIPSAFLRNEDALELLASRIAFYIAKHHKRHESGDYISKNEAYRIKEFGRKNVDLWVAIGLIEVKIQGNRHLLEYDRLKELSLMPPTQLKKLIREYTLKALNPGGLKYKHVRQV